MAAQYNSFDEVKDRLEQIVDEVNAEGITLDDALALYEEAVKLGLSACDLSEQDALAAYEAEQGVAAEQEAAADSASAPEASEGASSTDGEKPAESEEAENVGEAASVR